MCFLLESNSFKLPLQINGWKDDPAYFWADLGLFSWTFAVKLQEDTHVFFKCRGHYISNFNIHLALFDLPPKCLHFFPDPVSGIVMKIPSTISRVEGFEGL